MWSVLSRVGQLLGLVSNEPIVDEKAIAAVLDADDEVPEDEKTADVAAVDNNGISCQHRVGIITALYDKHGFIKSDVSSQLYFRRQDGPPNLKVGHQVVCLVFRVSEDNEWKVRKILYVENDLWDNNEDPAEDVNLDQPVREECETAYKHVIAKVSGRQGRTVLAGELQFSLDSVKVDFIPVEGDWLVLESLVQTESSQSEADTLLMVNRVTPVRSQTLEGKVSHWSGDTQQGIIDGEAVFSQEACQPGYLPRVGDQVRACSIESEQGQLTWRAITVVPTVDSQVNISHDPQALADLLQDKHGIVISEDTNCGVLYTGQEKQLTIEVRNESNITQTLEDVEFTAIDSQFKLTDPSVFNPTLLTPEESLQLIFKVKARFVGRSTEMVVFKFKGFDIGRQLVVDVQNTTLAASLSESRGRAPRSKVEAITAKKLLATRNGFIVPGVKPIKPASFVPVHLGMFVIPEKLVNLVLDSEAHSSKKEEVISRVVEQYRFLNEPADARNYVNRWHLLIHLEELAHAVNIARYNTTASLHRVQDYLCLDVPGLAERRPSLMVGDRVIAREAWTDENSWAQDVKTLGYEGYIHKVLSNEILIKFNPSFHDSCSGVYSISFEGNRTSFRRGHQAVHVAFRNLGADWLFPSCITYQPPQIVIIEEDNFISTENTNKAKTEVETVIDKTVEENNTRAEDANPCLESQDDTIKNNELEHINISKDELKADILKENDDQNEKESKTISINDLSTAHEIGTEIKNDYKNGDNGNFTIDDLATVEKSIDEIISTAKSITTNKEQGKVNKRKDPIEKRAKTRVSDMFEKKAPKDETHQKISPPRQSVVTRFLQNGNCPSTEKSPKEVKNMLQQLASLPSSENKLVRNHDMKTLEEIEKSLLNHSSSNNELGGIKPLPAINGDSTSSKEDLSPFEKFLKSSGTDNPENKSLTKEFVENEKQSANSSGDNKTVTKNAGKMDKNSVNELAKALRHNQNKVEWNSNIEMKIGNLKEANSKIANWKRKKVKWFNPLLNHYQKEAIRNILKGEARPLPYVIFGPPGTGKTITLVEAILQIYFLIPESRLLIATPSNSAADLVCERLLDAELLAPGDLLRLVGFHYADQGRVPDKLRPFCGSADIKAREDQYNSPAPKQEGMVNLSRHAIGRHRITVGTCNTLGILYQMGFPRGHFSHVLVDEAGQATEPEILIPLAFLHSTYGQAVLAGDPLQLGPVVLSRVAEHFGLGESLLSRLLLRTPYCRDVTGYPSTGGYNPHLVTRLVYNYRSLPEILSLPNQMFYNGDLIPQLSEESSDEVQLLERLRAVLPPRPDSVPPAMVFHGVRGTNCQAPDSPSWYNPHEAVQAVMYLQALYACGLTPEQCGILTPYQAQALKIRQMLETLEVLVPKVGSVEEFQGQERLAIILSTVRSSPRLVEADLRHTVGFVASPRRLNVAITRARALLIVVGNPHLLARDQYWRAVLEYCVRNRAYTGCDLPQLGS